MTVHSIAGAGLSGLIAAHAFPNAQVYEINDRGQMHKALLRFRGQSVSNLTGIEFKKVLVRKGIWSGGKFVEPNIRLANLYSKKVIGTYMDRSIWNIESVERYIAPPDFYERLVEQVGSRLHFNTEASFEPGTISTAPITVAMAATGMEADCTFRRKAIEVDRAVVDGAELYQTIYFPDPFLSVYRASMSGEEMIIESTRGIEDEDADAIADAFGMGFGDIRSVGKQTQQFGKIQEIEPSLRKQLLFELTDKYGIYSLGRFATWRQILLDDLIQDIAVIKNLDRANSQYDLRRHAS